MGKVVRLADKADNNKYTDPTGALRDAQESIEEKVGAFANGKKLAVICLDDTSGGYDVSTRYAGLKCSEILALLEYEKSRILSMMA